MFRFNVRIRSNNAFTKFLAILVFIILFIVVNAISFAATIGIYYLICWCFDLTFSIKIALGIWLILIILQSIFRRD